MAINQTKHHDNKLKRYFKRNNELAVFKRLLFDSKSYLYYLPKDIAKIIELYLIKLVEINRITTNILNSIFYTILMYNCIIKVNGKLFGSDYEYYIKPSYKEKNIDNYLIVIDKKTERQLLICNDTIKNHFHLIILNKRSCIYRFFAIIHYYMISKILIVIVILIIFSFLQFILNNLEYLIKTFLIVFIIICIDGGVYIYLIKNDYK